MRLRLPTVIISLFLFLVFTVFSYSVAKEHWTKIDFDTTVRLQDHIPRRFDQIFSYFSIAGSAEVTVTLAVIISLWYLMHKRLLAFIGWLLILPAFAVGVFGKLVIFHPGPPFMFYRTIIDAKLPSFYLHTNFSYPSGHVTRTIFLVTVFTVLILTSNQSIFRKMILVGLLVIFGGMMVLTRVYLGEHWLSDVIGGVLLGLSAGLFASALITGKRALH